MGLKSGSRDAGLDGEEEQNRTEETSRPESNETEVESETGDAPGAESQSSGASTQTASQRPTV